MPQSKEQISAYNKEYYETNKEQLTAYKKEYKKNNKEKTSAYNKEYYETNKEQRSAYSKRWNGNNKEYLAAQHREKKYGISPEDYDTMLKEQDNKCKICLVSFTTLKPQNIHVDHCHTTKQVRGLLCNLCNMGLGTFKDYSLCYNSYSLMDRGENKKWNKLNYLQAIKSSYILADTQDGTKIQEDARLGNRQLQDTLTSCKNI